MAHDAYEMRRPQWCVGVRETQHMALEVCSEVYFTAKTCIIIILANIFPNIRRLCGSECHCQ